MAGPRKRDATAHSAQGMLLDISSQDFWKRFPHPLAGLDEAGRGCLAGPVIAAAVILPDSFVLEGLDDSKKLSAKQRGRLAPQIKSMATAWAIGASWPREIETINILQASLAAMCRAVDRLRTRPVFLAVDGNQPVPLDTAQQCIIGGDAKVPAIAAASIIAKTFRDKLLVSLDKRYPGYGFAQHKGYATRDHYAALERLGPCPMHRMTFHGVSDANAPAPAEQACLLPI